ncbi:MAG: methyltransferase domain-containing protein [Christensenellales bacterium]|nr:methyltransferase domain-containing protein [Christensenellales bacterium]
MGEMIERLDFSGKQKYSAVEATIHLNRYAMARPYVAGKRVLDVASGEGYGSFLLRRWGAESVEGIDVDEQTVETATRLFGGDGVHYQCHTAEQLPFEDHTFDVVCSFETIEHLDHPELFLQEIRRVLKPGGNIILSCPNDPYYYKQGTPGNPFHKRQYTYFDFKQLAEKYLGQRVRYYLAYALNGFVNLPIEESTLPPEGGEESPLPTDMMEMFNYKDAVQAVCVSGERYLNHWNANYFVGIWGPNNSTSINASIFPRETFIEIKDEDEEFLREVARLKEDFEKHTAQEAEYARQLEETKAVFAQQEENSKQQLEAGKAYIEHIKEEAARQAHVAELEQQRTSMMLELVNKEKDMMQQSYARDYAELTRLREQYNQLSTENAQHCEELRLIHASRGFKLLNMGYPIKKRIWKIFGKEI